MGWHLCKSFAWEDQEWQQNVPRRDKKFDLFLNAAIKLIPKVCKSCHLSRALFTGFVAWIEAIKSELKIILKSNHFWNIFSSTFHSNQLIIIFLSPLGPQFSFAESIPSLKSFFLLSFFRKNFFPFYDRGRSLAWLWGKLIFYHFNWKTCLWPLGGEGNIFETFSCHTNLANVCK